MYDCIPGQSELVILPDIVSIMFDCVPGQSELVILADVVSIILMYDSVLGQTNEKMLQN